MSEQEMRGEILALVRAYCERYHAPKEDFSPGDRLPYAARVYDHEEMENLVASALEFWLTAGHYTEEFERGLAAYLGVKHCSLVNSGGNRAGISPRPWRKRWNGQRHGKRARICAR